jgi:large subunit ribosomal protein L29
MKAKDWRSLGVHEVETKVGQLRGELFTARIRKETGQLENTAKLRTLRRDIARAETILREMKVSRGPQGREAAAQRGEAERSVGPRKRGKTSGKSRAASRRRAKTSGRGAGE